MMISEHEDEGGSSAHEHDGDSQDAGVGPITAPSVIFYELGKGDGDRPHCLRYWRKQASTMAECREIVRQWAAIGDIPGREQRPLPLAARVAAEVIGDHALTGFDDEDLSISIERGTNLYAIRIAGPEERSVYPNAMFGDNPLNLCGIDGSVLAKAFGDIQILADGGSKGQPVKFPTPGSWLVFSCDRTALIAAIGEVYSPRKGLGDAHFPIPFRFNFIDRDTNLPIWLSQAQTTKEIRDKFGGSGLADHDGWHPDRLSRGSRDHDGWHPDFIQSYFYV